MVLLVFMSCRQKKGVVETSTEKKPNNQRDQKEIRGQYSSFQNNTNTNKNRFDNKAKTFRNRTYISICI